MQPVHAWKCNQTTEGFRPRVAASAILVAALDVSPTDAAAMVMILMNSRRLVPPAANLLPAR